jgi:hypothetical protein
MSTAKKTCVVCEVPMGLDNFSRSQSDSDGRRSYCRWCRSAFLAKQREKAKDRKRAASQIAYASRPGVALKRAIRYANRATRKIRSIQYANNWQKRNPEKVRERLKRYVAGIPDAYVRGILKHGGGIANPTPKQIQAKRESILAYRAKKTNQ